MPGLVIDPDQNPTEGRLGYFMDTEDGHIKLYLKLDEDNTADVTLQSRYFTFHTPVNSYHKFETPIKIDVEEQSINFNLEIHLVENRLKSKQIQNNSIEDQPITEKLNQTASVILSKRDTQKKYKNYDKEESEDIKKREENVGPRSK